MARYTVRVSYVDIIGTLWMPSTTAATRIKVNSHDVENMRDDDVQITRDSVEDWLTSHSGDFSRVIDFSASIEDNDTTVDIPWADEDSEFTYNDCMFPDND